MMARVTARTKLHSSMASNGASNRAIVRTKHVSANGVEDGLNSLERNKNAASGSDFTDDSDRWKAVVRRDARSVGMFFYSVQTTGVYCRPDCPSRLARRENVRFHDTCSDAERAGFRPCKRCRPNELPPAARNAKLVGEACALIAAAEDLPNLDSLAKASGLSRFHFHRVFKSVVGVTPKAYVAACRAERVREQLPKTETITDAIYGSGFNSNGRFYADSCNTLGMTPTKFRSGGIGEEIYFAAGECSLGSIVVAATQKGVCAILLGDEPGPLVHNLQDRFPKAKLIGGDRNFENHVAKVVGFVERPAIGLGLPLDVRGTAFQQRVWQALRRIPMGATASYTQIARQIGSPKSVRAVAQACAANAIAVAIPCHRVVRSDGGLSGYRWGVERKRELLKRESER